MGRLASLKLQPYKLTTVYSLLPSLVASARCSSFCSCGTTWYQWSPGAGPHHTEITVDRLETTTPAFTSGQNAFQSSQRASGVNNEMGG